MAKRTWGGYVRKQGRRVANALRKRYVKKGNLSLTKIAKDVSFLKGLINVEKKMVQFNAGVNTLGAQKNTANGDYLTTNLFTVDQGLSSSTRTGNSVKLTGIHVQGILAQQNSCQSTIDVDFYMLYWPRLTNSSASSPTQMVASDFMDTDSNGYRSLNSFRVLDKMSQFKIICKKRIRLRYDDAAGTAYKSFSFGCKIPKSRGHMRYAASAANSLESGSYNFYAVASTGDCGTALTGCNLQFQARAYFVDN